MSMTYGIIKNANLFNITSSYATDNMNFDFMTWDSCGLAMFYQGTVDASFGSMTCINCTENSGTIGLFFLNHSGTVNFTRMIFLNSFPRSAFISIQQGTVNLTTLMFDITGSGTNFGMVRRNAGTPNCTIGRIYIFNPNLNVYPFVNWTVGTLNVNGGLVRAQVAMSNCLNQLATFDGVDWYGEGYQKFNLTGGGNLNNNYVDGFSTDGFKGGTAGDVELVSGGVVDGVADVNTGVYANMDSVLNPRSTPNFPLTVGAVAVSAIGDNGATFTFTPNSPGKCWIVLSRFPRTVNVVADLDLYEIRSKVEYEAWRNDDGTGRLQDVVTARNVVIADGLIAGVPHFVRAVMEEPDGELFFSIESSFTTTGVSGQTPVGVKIMVQDVANVKKI